MEIGRLLTAMVTPFDREGKVDYAQAQRLASALLDSGSDGLVVGGTTGEAPTLRHDEKLRLFAAVKEAVGGRGAVLAGTGTNDTAASIELAQGAAIIDDAGEEFYVWSGDDALTLPILALGGYGVIAVVSHLTGTQLHQLIEDYLAGRTAEAARAHRRLLPLMQ